MRLNSKMTYEEWIAIADEYYLGARSLQWFSGIIFPTTFLGHHALEMYLKSVTVRVSGTYLDNHDLKTLYKEAIKDDPSIENEIISLAIDKYYNYDQVARYPSNEVRESKKPTFPAMGTDSLKALDFAVALLRDMNIKTGKGLDCLINGENYLTKME